MADSTTSATPVAKQWDEDVIFSVLGEPIRAAMLCQLALKGPQTAFQLQTKRRRNVDPTLKHLIRLRDAGLVVATKLSGDFRLVYSLAPTVPPITTGLEGKVIDFGFCRLRCFEPDKLN